MLKRRKKTKGSKPVRLSFSISTEAAAKLDVMTNHFQMTPSSIIDQMIKDVGVRTLVNEYKWEIRSE